MSSLDLRSTFWKSSPKPRNHTLRWKTLFLDFPVKSARQQKALFLVKSFLLIQWVTHLQNSLNSLNSLRRHQKNKHSLLYMYITVYSSEWKRMKLSQSLMSFWLTTYIDLEILLPTHFYSCVMLAPLPKGFLFFCCCFFNGAFKVFRV